MMMNNSVWNIDEAQTSIYFAVRNAVASKLRGYFAQFSGAVCFDEGDNTPSTVELRLDAESIYTGIAERDLRVCSDAFLDASRFPTIRFRSKRIESLDRARFRVVGDLTIHNQTREVAFEAAHGRHRRDPWGNERLGFVARAAIDSNAFGLKWNHILQPGGPIPGDELDVELELEAVRASADAAA
jgi:polyisoprenoid-binding protein YceI